RAGVRGFDGGPVDRTGVGERIRELKRYRETRGEAKGQPAKLYGPGRTQHQSAHDVPRTGAKSECGTAREPRGWRARRDDRRSRRGGSTLMANNVHGHATSTATLAPGLVPVIGPGHDFETVTEAVSQIPLAKRTPLGWVFGFLIGLSLLMLLQASLGYLVVKGIGIWGTNIP